MNNKLIILQGIPGSCKSTKARQIVSNDSTKNTIIINRDYIREMLGDYWVPQREPLVTAIEDIMIKMGLQYGYDVIVDAPNLNPATIKKLERIAKQKNIETIEFIPLKVSVLKAFIFVLWRTLKGGRFISYKVIKGFYDKYKHIVGV